MATEQAKTIEQVLIETGITDRMGERVYGLHFVNPDEGGLNLAWTEKDGGYTRKWSCSFDPAEKIVGELIVAGVPKYQESANF